MKSRSFFVSSVVEGKVIIHKIGKTKLRMLLEALKSNATYNIDHLGTKVGEIDYTLDDLKSKPDEIMAKHNLLFDFED